MRRCRCCYRQYQNCHPQIAIKMYVLPNTIQEFRRSLVNYEGIAKSFRVTKNIIDVGVRSDISGVLQTYFKRVRDSGYRISAKDYFDPYHNDTVSLLAQHNVNVLEDAENRYSSDQATIDDALEQQTFYKSKFMNEPKRQKSYEQIWHDMVLWHYISDRRPSVADTVFEAQWVGVTIDYGLMAFDSHKRKGRGIPSMVHPAALVQALQMLIPADENLERTILALMQMPFLFEAFNLDDEKVTQRILSSISRFDNIDDLSQDAILEVLGNKALRTQMERPLGRDEELTLVKDAIVSHAAELERRADEAARDLELLGRATKEAEATYTSRIADIESRRAALELEKASAEKAGAVLAEERNRAAAKVDILNAENRARDLAEIRAGQITTLAVQLLTCFGAATLAIQITIRNWDAVSRLGWWGPYATLFTAIACAFIATGYLAGKHSLVSETWYAIALRRAGTACKGILAFLILSVIGPLVYDTVKPSIVQSQSDQ